MLACMDLLWVGVSQTDCLFENAERTFHVIFTALKLSLSFHELESKMRMAVFGFEF